MWLHLDPAPSSWRHRLWPPGHRQWRGL